MYKFLILIILITVPYSSCALPSLHYSDMGITDDTIAAGISQKHKPPSVSQTIAEIRSNAAFTQLQEVDLSCNTICLGGATQIIRFAVEELPQLTTLDLSHNRIFDWRGTTGNDTFEEALTTLLSRQNFQKLDLRANSIATSDWMRHIREKLGDSAQKIIWNSDEV